MNGGTRIVSIGAGEETAEEPLTTATSDEISPVEEQWEDLDEPAPTRTGVAPLLPWVAVVVVGLWSAFFIWANGNAMMTGATPMQWAEWIARWATPVLLVVAIWLLVMRTSSREANRFNDVARALSIESTKLEDRLSTVNRELSLAREFIASQSRDLESLGRVSVERLSKNADRLAGLIQDNGAQIETISNVSSNALENMGKLRNELPVIANSARDVTNQIGNAGRVAQNQLQELVSGFHRLNEFGDASERQVQGLRAQVDAALAAFQTQASKLDEIATARFAALDERSLAFRSELDNHEIATLVAIRSRAQTLSSELTAARTQLADEETQSLAALRHHIETLSDHSASLAEQIRQSENRALDTWKAAVGELETRLQEASAELAVIDAEAQEGVVASQALWNEEFARRRNQSADWHAEHIATTNDHLAKLDAAIAERQSAHTARSREIASHAEAIAAQLAIVGSQIQEVGVQGGAVQNDLNAALDALTAKLTSSRETIADTDQAVASLTDSSVRLLELIRAGAKHSREDLPAAINIAIDHLNNLAGNAQAVHQLMHDANDKGSALSQHVADAQRDGREAMADVERFHASFAAMNADQTTQLAQFRTELAALLQQSEAQAAAREQNLRDVIAQLRDATQTVITEMEHGGAEAASRLAAKIGNDSAEAINRAVKLRAAEAVGQLEQAAAHASGVSREAAVQLRDQLAKVAELTSNLENRVTYARQRAEEQVDNDFARRVALITEALNSNAIDIAKALSNDVTDTAWASYLRGDRGIFTRRAVRLLDTAESRILVDIYENDHDFREHVNRYVHDFEAMLRQLLSTRDGHALSVTLLSSDMGKLYVALAQAIERLRE